jgi:CRP-like cAMP-binding protein
MNSKDTNELPKELVKLGRNAHFGEIALLTAEPRSATVTVISNDAKCLRMTKQKFDELLVATNQIQAENRKLIGRDVLDTVPLFKSLTSTNKKKLLDAMLPMSYHQNSYICRQGTAGNVFFILTEGTCRITVNTQDGQEREVARLHPGDFFGKVFSSSFFLLLLVVSLLIVSIFHLFWLFSGEVALIEASARRTANVISLEAVSCLTLSRNDFHRLLKSLKVKILEHQATRGVSTQQAEQSSEIKQLNSLSRKRRISGFNTHGQRDEVRIGNILRRFARFTTESLWNSLYSRMYREMLLDPNKVNEYGKYASFVIKSTDSRWEGVKAVEEQALRILELDPARRTPADHSFIFGLMKQRNGFKDRLCKNWPIHQFQVLCKKIRIMRVKSFRKIIEVDSRGSTVFMILRGSVRIFSRMPGTSSRVIYEEDLFPGEIFGEAVLSGMHTRLLTALSITNVELAVIDDQDYMTAQDRDSVQMGTEEKSRFLSSIPMFRNWDTYKLLRLAHALTQDEFDKNTVMNRHHQISKDIYFVVNGRVDVFDSLHKRNTITSFLKYDYFGESGFLNKFMHKIPAIAASSAATNGVVATTASSAAAAAAIAASAANSKPLKVTEEFYSVAVTKLEVLVLHEANYHLFDMSSIEPFRDAFLAKQMWRQNRVKKMKLERASVRRKYAVMRFEGDQLPEWNSNEEIPSDDDDELGSDTEILLTRPMSASPTKTNTKNNAYNIDEVVEQEPLGLVDTAYQNALVHPLDDRLNNDKYWRARAYEEEMEKMSRGIAERKEDKHAIVTPKEMVLDQVNSALRSVKYAHFGENKEFLLNHLEDIPVILAKDFDLLMVSASRESRHFDKAQPFLVQGRRPISGRMVPYHPVSANDLNKRLGSPENSKPSSPTHLQQQLRLQHQQQQQQQQQQNQQLQKQQMGISQSRDDLTQPEVHAEQLFNRVPSSANPMNQSNDHNIHKTGLSINTNSGVAFYYNNQIMSSSFDLNEGMNQQSPNYYSYEDNNNINNNNRNNLNLNSAETSPKNKSRRSSLCTPGVKPTYSLPVLSPNEAKKEYQFKFLDDEIVNNNEDGNETDNKGMFLNDSFDENGLLSPGNTTSLGHLSSGLPSGIQSRRVSYSAGTIGNMEREMSSRGQLKQSTSMKVTIQKTSSASPTGRAAVANSGGGGGGMGILTNENRRPSTSPAGMKYPQPQQTQQQQSSSNKGIAEKSTDSDIHDSQLMIIKTINNNNNNRIPPKPFSCGMDNKRKPSSAINHQTVTLSYDRPQALIDNLLFGNRPNSQQQQQQPQRRKNSVIAIELDPEGNELSHQHLQNQPQQQRPQSSGGRALYSTASLNNNCFLNNRERIPLGNKLPFLNNHNHRPFSSTNPKSNIFSKQPPQTGNNNNNNGDNSARDNNKVNNNSNDDNNSSAGGSSILIRGQYLLVASAAQNNNMNNTSNNKLNQRPHSSIGISSSSANRTAGIAGLDDDANNSGQVERRSFQPPRLLHQQMNANKLITQRRKN